MAAVEDQNTLSSNQVFRLLDLLSEGEIVGLVNGDKSIFFGETPLQGSDGRYNFTGVTTDFRFGLASQTYVRGFPDVETVFPVNTQITVASGGIIYSTHDTNVDSVRLTINYPEGMTHVNNATGDIHGTGCGFDFQTRPVGGIFSTADYAAFEFGGKATSAFQQDFEIGRPSGSGLWDVKIIRRSTFPDDPDAYTKNRSDLQTVTEIQNKRLTYPNSAYAYVSADAKSLGNSIPTRGYRIKGIKCHIPSNYNPTTRVYTGTWDLTFQVAYTNNPAWILYECLTNTRWGLGKYITSANVDLAAFYNAAIFNDGAVDDGTGTSTNEPRFTFNAYMNTSQGAWNFLQTIAATMRSVVYYAGGIVSILQDRPGTAVAIIGKSDVVDGKFTYSSTSRTTRVTACNVSYSNPANHFKPTIVNYPGSGDAYSASAAYQTALAAFGYKTRDIAGVGITSEGQARRFAKWNVLTELEAGEIVKFQGSFNICYLTPGEIFKLSDTDYQQLAQHGRLQTGSTTTSIKLDRFVTLASGTNTLTIVLSDGITLQSRTISNVAGTYSTISVSSAFSEVPAANATWQIEGVVVSRLFRVVNVKESAKGIFDFAAVEYNGTIYTEVETGVVVPPPVFTALQIDSVKAPTNAVFTQRSSNTPNGIRFNLEVDWTPSVSPFVYGYTVKWRVNQNNYSLSDVLHNPTFTLVDIDEGTYDFIITALNARGISSPELTASYVISTRGTSAFSAPQSLQIVGGGYIFDGADCHFSWVDPNINNYNANFRDYEVRIYDFQTLALLRTDHTTVNNYTYTYLQSLQDGGPRTNIRVEVLIRDTYLNITAPIAANFARRGPPRVTGLSLKGQPGSATQFTGTDAQFVWNAYSSLAGGFGNTPTGVGVGTGVDPNFGYYEVTIFDGSHVQRRQERVGDPFYSYSYDKNFSDGVIRSFTIEVKIVFKTGEKSADPAGLTVSNPPPALPTGLKVQGDYVTVTVAFNTPADNDYRGMLMYMSTTGGFTTGAANLVADFSDLTMSVPANPGTTYYVRLAPYDLFGKTGLNMSPEFVVSTVSLTLVAPIPTIPTGLTLTKALQTLTNGQIVSTIEASWSPLPINTYTGYTLRIHEGTDTNYQYASVGEAKHTFIGVKPGVTYGIAVRADNGGSFSSYSSEVTTTAVTDAVAPAAVTNLSATFSFKGGSLSWVNPTDADFKYCNVYRALSNDKSTATIVAKPSMAFFIDTGLTTGTSYYYWVSAVDTSGNESATNPASSTSGIVIVPGQSATGDYAVQSITNAAIANLAVDNANIVQLSAAKLMANTVMADSIQLGGQTAANIGTWSEDPLFRANQKSTLLAPGNVLIAGGVTLGDWRSSLDQTKISGGALAARTITADKIEVGASGVQVQMTIYPIKPAGASVYAAVGWDAGTITYREDNLSTNTQQPIGAGNSPTWDGVNAIYIYWVKGEGALRSTTTYATAVAGSTNLLIATYQGGNQLYTNGQRTLVDGGSIIADSITATQLIKTATLITSNAQIGGGVITSANIANSTITKSNIVDSTLTMDKFAGQLNSTDFDPVTHKGISIQTTDGKIICGNIEIWNPITGQLVLSSGSGLAGGINFNQVSGTGQLLQSLANQSTIDVSTQVSGLGPFATIPKINTANVSTLIDSAAVNTLMVGQLDVASLRGGQVYSDLLRIGNGIYLNGFTNYLAIIDANSKIRFQINGLTGIGGFYDKNGSLIAGTDELGFSVVKVGNIFPKTTADSATQTANGFSAVYRNQQSIDIVKFTMDHGNGGPVIVFWGPSPGSTGSIFKPFVSGALPVIWVQVLWDTNVVNTLFGVNATDPNNPDDYKTQIAGQNLTFVVPFVPAGSHTWTVRLNVIATGVTQDFSVSWGPQSLQTFIART